MAAMCPDAAQCAGVLPVSELKRIKLKVSNASLNAFLLLYQGNLPSIKLPSAPCSSNQCRHSVDPFCAA